MKRNLYLRGMLAVVLAATLCAFTPGSLAQSGQEAQPPAQSNRVINTGPADRISRTQPDQQQSKTFEGKILKMQDGKFALVTGQTPQGQMAGHFLDDQDGASKYEGKQVKVTGTLEEASNTIHVTRFEAA